MKIRPRLGLLVGFWMCVGLFGGTTAWIGQRLAGSQVRWVDVVGSALGASLIWIPISMAAIALAVRYQVSFHNWFKPLVAHGSAALAVSFVLNSTYFAGVAWLGDQQATLGSWAVASSAAGFFYLHINALVYLVIVGVTHAYILWRRSRPLVVSGNFLDPDFDWERLGAALGAPCPNPRSYLTRLSTGTKGRTTLVDVGDIRWIEADGDYARVHANGSEHLVSTRMKHLETLLDPARFVRIHRSRIVNIDHVRDLRHIAHGDYEVTLDDDTVLRVSRARRKQLMEAVDSARG